MRSLCTYLWYWVTRREVSDFVDMGLGIAARQKKARRAWAAHLELSRALQAEALVADPALQEIVILGAGRLYDVPLERFATQAKKISLYDADPSAVARWREVSGRWPGVKITGYEQELTGVLHEWTRLLSAVALRGELNAVVAQLENLPAPTCAIRHPGSLVVSLNLLSQIPLYWRDRAEKILKSNNLDPEFPRLKAALAKNYQTLQRHHLELLDASEAKSIVVITDRTFMYYRPDLAPWQCEDALHGVEVNLPNYTKQKTKSWFWHVVPFGCEGQDYGSIHDVVGVVFDVRK